MPEQLVARTSQQGLRRIATVAALDEEPSIGAVIGEIRAAGSELDVIRPVD
jgi:hypothetical protein